MTYASPPPPFVVFDPLLWVGFRETVKQQECWSRSSPHSEGAQGQTLPGIGLPPADQELCGLGQVLSSSQVVCGDSVLAG